MTAVAGPVPAPPRARTTALLVALALTPGLLVLLGRALLAAFLGEWTVPAYGLLMNGTVALRAFGTFGAVVLVWAPLRSRGASRPVLALAVLSGPLTYAVTAALGALAYFPPGQAAYYGLNPMVWAALGSQVAGAALTEMCWRAFGGRRRPAVTWGLVLAAGGGAALAYVAVLWHGGVHAFYLYQQGFRLLFA